MNVARCIQPRSPSVSMLIAWRRRSKPGRVSAWAPDETMNSDTIGIPRFGPGGYYLTNVLFTQYFTGDGASLHYNYWSGAWGYPGSHGCLGLTYADSAWLWGWAHIGTPVVIHY